MGRVWSALVFTAAFGWAASARAAERQRQGREADAKAGTQGDAADVVTERSGLSFGLSLGLGKISHQGVVIAAGWRVGYALSPRVVLLGDFTGFMWNGSDPPAPTAAFVDWRDLAFFSLAAQVVLLRRLWVRPGLGTAEWHGVRYSVNAMGQQATRLGGYVPAAHLAVGVDVSAGKHNVFDVVLSSYAFSRDRELTYAGALLLGYSYY